MAALFSFSCSSYRQPASIQIRGRDTMIDMKTAQPDPARLARWLPLILATALAAGCATGSPGQSGQPPAATTPDAGSATTASGAGDTAEFESRATATALPAQPDPAAARISRNGTAEGQAFDPWEPFNRRVHDFNLQVDRYIARPLAVAYSAVTPQPVRKGVGNFFSNLYQPVTAVHLMLQGRPVQSGSALLRFTMNATLGLGGFLDPATEAGLRQYSGDFGQTLGKWGWTDSRYLVLPLIGSSTLRDTFGRVGDAPLNPIRQVNPERDRFLIQGLGLVDLRAMLLDLGELEADAGDSYTLFRDTYLQRRRFLITSDEEQLPDYLLDDDFDDIDFE